VVEFSDDEQESLSMKMLTLVNSGGLVPKLLVDPLAIGPALQKDRVSAIKDFLSRELTSFGKTSHETQFQVAFALYSEIEGKLKAAHSAFEVELLRRSKGLSDEIASREPDWWNWSVATRKKLAFSWLQEHYSLSSRIVAEEIARVKR
jgi:hypothetical protein